jgi:hypothetical protein
MLYRHFIQSLFYSSINQTDIFLENAVVKRLSDTYENTFQLLKNSDIKSTIPYGPCEEERKQLSNAYYVFKPYHKKD